MKVNPQNESFYLPHPDGGYVQFENMVNNVLQDGKCVVKDKSFYYAEDMPGLASDQVLSEARRQPAADAANANYRVEWLVSNQRAIDQLTALSREHNVDITITYFPE